ncbi:helix-turn-helix transcriptional regulator [Brevundimonas sp.]|uniref:helix-turn-helix domain-containing protein n=1 Tax=Brevundimonas sp. TaxID=1871086 RepID=UPI0025BEA155|nr:helix-turn-helix transcriptional regulator [Brevundimonas sp.]
MARFESDEEARALGEALARLRRDQGLSQAEAGARAGMTSQAWGLYEAGKRPGLFRPDIQRRLTEAIGATVEALVLQTGVASPAPPLVGTGVSSSGRAFSGVQPAARTAGRHQFQVSNDDLWPWAASGVVLEYEPGRWPRRDQGCIVEMRDGRRLARLYHGADETTLYLRGGPDGFGSEERVRREEMLSISAVIARLDA